MFQKNAISTVQDEEWIILWNKLFHNSIGIVSPDSMILIDNLTNRRPHEFFYHTGFQTPVIAVKRR